MWDLFDLRAKTPPLSNETTDEWEKNATVKCQSDTVFNGNIHSEWMKNSTDHHFSMNGDWIMVSHYRLHGDWSKTLKCNISASNKARDMRFSVFAFIIRALYGIVRWIPSEIMAKYGQNTHTSPTPYVNTHFVLIAQLQYWQYVLMACPLVHLPGVIPMFAKSFNILN